MQFMKNSAKKKRLSEYKATASSDFFQSFEVHHKIYFLSSLFFAIYINNLSNHVVSTVKQLAADH